MFWNMTVSQNWISFQLRKWSDLFSVSNFQRKWAHFWILQKITLIFFNIFENKSSKIIAQIITEISFNTLRIQPNECWSVLIIPFSSMNYTVTTYTIPTLGEHKCHKDLGDLSARCWEKRAQRWVNLSPLPWLTHRNMGGLPKGEFLPGEFSPFFRSL